MTRDGPVWQCQASVLADAFADGRLTPDAVLAEALERIGRLDASLNAFVALAGTARAEAEASTRRWAEGEPLSPLDGVPVAVKDNLAVAGLPATWGSPHYADFIPEADELPVARLRRAGMVVVGKTNVPEFTIEGYTANALFGVTGNPWNPALTPGGSSGGSVAAVAAGLVPLALGTDGGGSTRRPAAYTGLVGLKPSLGAIARGGGLPQILLDFEVVGPIGRTVADVARLFDLLSGGDGRDHRARVRPPGAGWADPVRILYVERFGEAPLDPVIAASVSAAVDAFEAMGCRVRRGALPFDIEPLNAFWPDIAMVGLARLVAADPAMRDRASAVYMDLADRGTGVPGHRFLAGLEAVWALRDRMGPAFRDVDVIITPSCAAMPWPADRAFPETIDGRAVGPRGHAVYTGWVNAAGLPGLDLPAAPAPDGLPIGFQMVGDLGTDRLLLDLGRRYEARHPWADRWPAMAGG